MNTQHLAYVLFVILVYGSNVAEGAPSTPASKQDTPAICQPVGISREFADWPFNADFQDTNEQLYSFTLLKCDESQISKNGYLLRVDSIDPESGKTSLLDKLPLPWVNPNKVLNFDYMDPTCNIQQTGEQIDTEVPVIGAIGSLVEVQAGIEYTVKGYVWIWSFNQKTKKLHLIHPDKSFQCRTDGLGNP
jgi:hypothetical protein